MITGTTNSIVFISGTFIGNNCWNEWKLNFENRGYTCLSPAWPNKYDTPEILRNRHPDPAIAANRLNDLTDYYADIVHASPQKPFIVGHSLGGLIVQLLLQRGLGRAGVAIHSFPPVDVTVLDFSLLKALWSPMGFFSSSKKSYMISFQKWKQIITNGMDCDEQKRLFYKYAIPESKRIIRD